MTRFKLLIIFVLLISAALPSFSKESKKESREEKMGRQIAEQYEKDLKLVNNEEINDRVNHIGRALSEIAKTKEIPATYGESRLENYSYRFRVVENEEINAFSLPGGYIYVYSGLINFAKSDDELAGVLAHEIAHASHHHVLALMKKQSKMGLLVALVALAGGFGKVDGRDLANVVYGLQSIQTARMSVYGQTAEYDADHAGVTYMRDAGYDPRAMISFFDRLNSFQEETGTVRNLGIFQTHPGMEDRLMRIAVQCNEIGMSVDMRDVAHLAKAETKPVLVDGKELFKVTLSGRDVCTLASTDDSTSLERAKEACVAINAILREEPKRLNIYISPETGELKVRGRTIITLDSGDCSISGKDQCEILEHASNVIEYAIWSDRVKIEYRSEPGIEVSNTGSTLINRR